MSELIPPAKRLLTPLSLPQNRLLTGPGPSNCDPRVLQASGLHLLGHLHPEFLKVMDDIKAGLQYIFQTENELTIAVSGTGHAGMEAGLVNVLERGDGVLVLKNGLWGDRVADIAQRCGATVNMIERPAGQVFTLDEITEALETYKPALLSVCHAETSGGTIQPLEGLGELCHRFDCLLFVDTVASLGGSPFYTDKWGVDIAFSGSQKCIGAPPGTAPITFSPRAREKMSVRSTKVQSFYFDMEWLAKYWAVGGAQRVYHHTGPVSSFYALREALAIIAEEGLEARWSRHEENAQLLWRGLEEMGLEMFVKDKASRLRAVTAVKVPSDVQWKDVVTYIMKTYDIEISGGLGPTAGQIWRIGLMGHNSTKVNVDRVLTAMKDGIGAGSTNKL